MKTYAEPLPLKPLNEQQQACQHKNKGTVEGSSFMLYCRCCLSLLAMKPPQPDK